MSKSPLIRTNWIADADIEWEILDEYCKRKIMAYNDRGHTTFQKGSLLVDSFNPLRADFIQ
jgi:hypothetical protein